MKNGRGGGEWRGGEDCKAGVHAVTLGGEVQGGSRTRVSIYLVDFVALLLLSCFGCCVFVWVFDFDFVWFGVCSVS